MCAGRNAAPKTRAQQPKGEEREGSYGETGREWGAADVWREKKKEEKKYVGVGVHMEVCEDVERIWKRKGN